LTLQILYWTALAATVLCAFRLGGRDERAGAYIAIAATCLTELVELLPGFDWRVGRSGLVLVDLGTLVAFFALAQRSSRFWPLWATAFQLITVTTHLVVFLRPSRILQAYAIAQGFWAYPIMMCIIIGAIGEHRRRTGNQARS